MTYAELKKDYRLERHSFREGGNWPLMLKKPTFECKSDLPKPCGPVGMQAFLLFVVPISGRDRK